MTDTARYPSLRGKTVFVTALLDNAADDTRHRFGEVTPAYRDERSPCLPGRVMPEDVAPMALFLAADDSAMITAQSFVVDGGWV